VRYPAFVAEMGQPANRPKLYFGVWSGFAIVIGFALLFGAAAATDVVAWRWSFLALISLKLLTNCVHWWSLTQGRWVLETAGLNTFTDMLVMTAAIYVTGGPLSPLFPIYVIEITVLALLSNLGVTLLALAIILVQYATMLVLVATGLLPPQPALLLTDGVPAGGQVLVLLGYAVIVVGLPAGFTTATLRLLRSKERALESRTRQLIEAGQQRTQFMAAMTHELRTPVHGVQGLADLVASGVYGPVSDRQREALGSIKRSAQQLLGLVDDVLLLAKAEADRLRPRPGPVELAELITQVVASATWMIGTKQLVVTTDLEAPLPAVQSDGRLLGHVLLNLLSNAVKFTPEHGAITVRARTDGDHVELAVIDTGIGIAPDRIAAIFEPFVQGEGGDDRRYGGAGLGLALVRRICAALVIEVDARSEAGAGATFTLRVPRAWRGAARSDDGAGDAADGAALS
jgi:signal transduction histidine kinase